LRQTRFPDTTNASIPVVTSLRSSLSIVTCQPIVGLRNPFPSTSR
jgi:hypothetical protein